MKCFIIGAHAERILGVDEDVLARRLASDMWMWLDEPARPKSHLAMKVTALPCSQAISLVAFLMTTWRSAMVSASA